MMPDYEQKANELYAWFEAQSDLTIDDYGQVMEVLSNRIKTQRIRAAIAEREARTAEESRIAIEKETLWANEHHVVDRGTYQQKYEINDPDFLMAVELGFLPPITYWNGSSSWPYYPDQRLTDQQRIQVEVKALYTADDAAKFLGIKRNTFDRLKKKHGIEVSARRCLGYAKWPSNLYLKSDLAKLRSLLAVQGNQVVSES